MPFLSILWFTWKWSFAIFLDYHGPGHKQITKVRWVCFFFFFSSSSFFLVMSVVHNVTWKKSTIVSMEWSQSLFIETGWPVYFSLFSFFFHAIYTCIQTYIHADILTLMSIHAICTCMYACSHTNIFAYPCITHLHACTHSSILFKQYTHAMSCT